jgi:hypothetical protein
MGTLTCDVCGGALVVSTGGKATCSICAIEHTHERLREKLSNAAVPTAPKPQHYEQSKSQRTGNELGSGSLDSIAIHNDYPTVSAPEWQVLFEQGRRYALQSTIEQNRFVEAADCFSRSLQHAPDSIITARIVDGAKVMCETALTLVQTEAQAFALEPNTAEPIIIQLTEIHDALLRCAALDADARDAYVRDASNILVECCDVSWHATVLPEYEGEDYHPNQAAFDLLLQRADACCEILEYVIEIQQDAGRAQKTVYELLITIHEFCCCACSWSPHVALFGTGYTKVNVLAQSAIDERNQLIEEYLSAIYEIESGIKYQPTAATKMFWQDHELTRTQLRQELQRLYVLLSEHEANQRTTVQNVIRSRIEAIEFLVYQEIIVSEEDFLHQIDVVVNSRDQWEQQLATCIVSERNNEAHLSAIRAALLDNIATQDTIIAQHSGLFGEPARIRKEAQHTKAKLLASLNEFTDT